MIKLILPLPPSINNAYWKGKIMKPAGRKFKADVLEIVKKQKIKIMNKDIYIKVYIFPPKNYKYDLDNRQKVLQDSLTQAFVWKDDSLVVHLEMFKGNKTKDGASVVFIEEVDDYVKPNFEDFI